MSDKSEVSTFCEHRMAGCKRCNSSNCNDYEFSKMNETTMIENESTINESISNASVSNGTALDDIATGGSVSLKSFIMTVLFSFSLTYVLKREKNLFIQ